MKRIVPLLFPALLIAAAPAGARQAPPRQPLRPVSECLDATRINEWHIIDNTTLTVRTGPFRYLLKTQHKCPRLGRHGDGLSFRVSEAKQVTLPRVCGDYGDEVYSRYQPPCAVESVRKIDKAQFDALTRRQMRGGSGAEQPPQPGARGKP